MGISGALFFGMCGVYEMQGPLNGLWLWPTKEGLVKANWNLWQFGELEHDKRGLVAHPHVIEALAERWCGFPTLAPSFHFAFGWGIAFAMQIGGFPSSIM